MDNGQATKPQPLLEEVGTLVENMRESGCRIAYRNELEGTPTPTVNRYAYRIIQECLTNAQKHAPGEVLSLSITGSPDAGITFVASNPLSEPAKTVPQDSEAGIASFEPPHSGLGLLGIQERVELVSGTMRVTRSPQ